MQRSESTETVLSWMPPAWRTAFSSGTPAREEWTEIRLRSIGVCSLTCGREGRNQILPGLAVSSGELRELLLTACGGSLHVYDEELRRGYLSPAEAPGVRIGLCGWCLCDGAEIARVREISSLAIRLPHTETDCGDAARRIVCGEAHCSGCRAAEHTPPRVRPTLFYGPPGCGKTTLLRHLTGALSRTGQPFSPLRTAVIDAGGELLYPAAAYADCIADFFSGYPLGAGISLAVRAFSPQVLICDEIGTEAEAEALLRAQAGGVPLIATAHAETLSALLCRPAFAALHEAGVFAQYIRVGRAPDGFSFTEEPEDSAVRRNKEAAVC